MSCCSVTSECGGDFTTSGQIWFHFNYMNCRPHVMVCLNLVHKKLRKSFHCWKWLKHFSLSLSWSMIFSDNFSFRYHECYFCFCFVFFKKKARNFPFTSQCYPVFLILFYFVLSSWTGSCCVLQDIRATVRPCADWCDTQTQFQTGTTVHFKWSGFSGTPGLSSLTWRPGGPQSQIMLFPRTPSCETCGVFVILMVSRCRAQTWPERKGSLFTYEGNSGRALQQCSCSPSNVLVLWFWGQLYVICLACFN